MRKNQLNMLEESKPKPPKRYGRTLLVVLLIAAFPLIYEGSLLCVAQWKSMFGRVEVVHTPVLDFIREQFTSAREKMSDFEVRSSPAIQWKPEVVVPLAILWTGVAVLILRRC